MNKYCVRAGYWYEYTGIGKEYHYIHDFNDNNECPEFEIDY